MSETESHNVPHSSADEAPETLSVPPSPAVAPNVTPSNASSSSSWIVHHPAESFEDMD